MREGTEDPPYVGSQRVLENGLHQDGICSRGGGRWLSLLVITSVKNAVTT